jgi:hypothetical protein
MHAKSVVELIKPDDPRPTTVLCKPEVLTYLEEPRPVTVLAKYVVKVE